MGSCNRNKFVHSVNARKHVYAASATSALLTISSLMVFIHMWKYTKYVLYSVPPFRSKYKTLISLGRFSSTNQIQQYTVPPGSCIFTLMYNKSNLYQLTLQSTSIHHKTVHGIERCFGFGIGIRPRIVDTKLRKKRHIHELRNHRWEKRF